jgi:TfoX/Sxy family transcriptional regulator of competence genes
MPYDEELADRIRDVLPARPAVNERKMFGGLAFLVGGHMGCGIVGDRLMVRVPPDSYEVALAQDHVQPMDFTGRPLRGFIYVQPDGLPDRPSLERWVREGVSYASSLPART